MFSNKLTNFPNAKVASNAADISAGDTAVGWETPKWTIKNISYVDEDTGLHYVEIINEVEMPIISTDTITFHVEFYTGGTQPTEGLWRDGFECTLTKQLTT